MILLARKDNFAAYLEDKYYDLMFSRLKPYIYQNRSRLNLHTSLVPDPSYVELDDLHVMGVSFKETEDDRILFRAAIQADVVVKGRSRRDYEEDIVSPWFSISFTGILRCGLNMVTILSVAEYSKEYFSKEDALSRYLVPYVYSKDLDIHAEKFLKKYCPRALDAPMSLPVKEVLEAMCLTVHLAPLPDGIFGRTYFNNATVEIYDPDRNVVSADIEEGTILVDPDVFFMRNIGSVNNTIIHECVHWDKHYKFFELQKLINPELTSISCAVVEEYKKKAFLHPAAKVTGTPATSRAYSPTRNTRVMRCCRSHTRSISSPRKRRPTRVRSRSTMSVITTKPSLIRRPSRWSKP